MFVSIMAFFAQVSDPAVGGTYMTLLNTITNLGGIIFFVFFNLENTLDFLFKNFFLFCLYDNRFFVKIFFLIVK